MSFAALLRDVEGDVREILLIPCLEGAAPTDCLANHKQKNFQQHELFLGKWDHGIK